MLGFGDKATEMFRMITPIEHARTKDSANKYKVEPYVIPADVYASGALAGRGGWTWYTGSASWYFKAGIEFILGIKVEKGVMKITPCIPSKWKEYSVRYKWKNSVYNIKVKNPNGRCTGEARVLLDGVLCMEGVRLKEDGKAHTVEVTIF
jgi:cellobiose phosphorylase